MTTTVLSLGGSIVAPDKPDSSFLKAFRAAVEDYLSKDPGRRLILVTGGGAPARDWQAALRAVRPDAAPVELDWIGIRSTHLNGQLVKAVFGPLAPDPLVTDPTAEDLKFTGRVLVAAGWKPGFSTDTDAVHLADRFGATTVLNLSNIAKVYTDDPRKNPEAKPLDSISWEEFTKMVGTEWTPGANTPFDPVASGIAGKKGMKVICADGRNIENTIAILEGRDFTGTTIG